ncbi:DAN domain family member 5 [Mastacembelus armatus]|uniref:DAN domain family, member 5 n=1 Tax=Mastacembelus armatus TaxID=205130 RepID=A0A3Q3L222_9TELE|nr:DAN domain family member 5-like [Mastacembelus armatus]
MAFLVSLVLLSSCWTAEGFAFSHNTFGNILKGSGFEFESSGGGADEPVPGIVKVVQLDPHAMAQSGIFRRGLTLRKAPSLSSRLSFPAFLSQGHPGPSPAFKAPVSPLQHLNPKSPTETELKKRQGLQMWQRVIDKGEKMTMSLPVNLKDTKQACTAIPFTQRVTAEGCNTVTVRNKLCFGQCSSLFVPSDREVDTVRGALHRPCSRCAPSKAHTVPVPLRCGAETRERAVMVVEECRCEAGREERSVEAGAPAHL